MARNICSQIVCVDERAVNSWHAFKNILQTLCQIVAVPEIGLLVQDNVNLDVQLVPLFFRVSKRCSHFSKAKRTSEFQIWSGFGYGLHGSCESCN